MKRLCAALLCAVVLLIPGAALCEGENLLVNGDFSAVDGDVPAGWRYNAWFLTEGYTRYEVIDEGGANVLHLKSYEANDARFEQRVAVKPDTVYRFSVMVKASGIGQSAAGAGIGFDNMMLELPYVYDTQGQYIPVEFLARTAPDMSEITLFLRLGGYASVNVGEAWFASAVVTEVSDPGGAYVMNLYTAAPQTSVETVAGDHSYELHTYLLFALYLLVGVYLYSVYLKRDDSTPPGRLNTAFMWILGAAAVGRLALAYMTHGYDVDVSCFRSWAISMDANGPWGFYADGFCDYPPGYMLVLWPLGALRSLLNIAYDSKVFVALIKLPAIICDIAGALVVYRFALKRLNPRTALALGALYAMNPAVIFNSSVWGQMDSVLVLLLLLVLIELMDKRMMRASLIYAAAVLIKPQALMFGTLLLAAFVHDILDNPKEGALRLLKCVAAAAGLFVVVCLPFVVKLGPWYVFEKYMSTLSSYPYAELNSFNLFALVGGNWVGQETRVLFLSYEHWGLLFMSLSVIGALALYWKARDRRALTLVWIVVMAGVFVFGVRMHERYIYPLLAGLIMAFAVYKDKRFLPPLFVFTLTLFVNLAMVMTNTHLHTTLGTASYNRFDRYIEIGMSSLNVLATLFIVWTAVDIAVFKRTMPAEVFTPTRTAAGAKARLKMYMSDGEGESKSTPTPEPSRKERKLNRRDALMLAALIAAYSILAFVNLGSVTAPQSQWTSSSADEMVTLDLGRETDIADFAFYGGIGEGSIMLWTSSDGVEYLPLFEIPYATNTMFRWQFTYVGVNARYLRMEMMSSALPLMEVAVLDEAHGAIPIAMIDSINYESERYRDPYLLIDEQVTVPERPTYYNGTYFDEIYHARTAYEHIHNIPWYETSHPPLGKALMSLSIMLFGMTPFGWRFAGVVAGILMIPGVYLSARLFFKRPFVAFTAAFLLSVDLMHFTQTRIATIDSFGVLFIIWMFYFMFRFALDYKPDRSFTKPLLVLLLAGVCMGLGMASKWIGAYAALGMAAVLFYTLWHGYASVEREKKHVFAYNTLALLGCCVFIFVLIPIGIYIASYWQYFNLPGGGRDLEGVWRAQLSMFGYHSGLTDDHPFASPWYEWPLIIRPMWYYMGERMREGYVSSINAMGNPAVWWAGLAAAIWMMYRFAAGKLKGDRRPTLILLGLAAQFLPWVAIPRSMFIYHYFASVPFLILLICFWVEKMLDEGKKRTVLIYMGVALAVFIYFLPMASGIEVPLWFAKLNRWLPTWTLFGG